MNAEQTSFGYEFTKIAMLNECLNRLHKMDAIKVTVEQIFEILNFGLFLNNF